jgi:beta-lactamase superfamily II metal-dependent hydrolase
MYLIQIFLILVLLLINITIFAHSGRIDRFGGHRDNQNRSGLGSYHFHHGYDAHLHSNGDCPFFAFILEPKQQIVPQQPSYETSASINEINTHAKNSMSIHFIDVGQGDSTFIDYGDYEILIDAGIERYGETVANYIRQYVDENIELIIATHPDADHIAGMDYILSNFDTEHIIYNGESKNTQTYRDFFDAANTEQNCELSIAKNEIINIDEYVSLQIFAPINRYDEANENSIVSLLTYDEVSFLFPGDMENNQEQDLMNSFVDINVLKAPHHGSRYTASAEFLNRVKPEYVIISAGKNNQYEHPHQEALQRFFDIGATMYGTFQDGNILITTNGKSLSFHTKTNNK